MADKPLTNREIIQKPDIVVHPLFFVPPGIREVRQGQGNDTAIGEYGGIAESGSSTPTTDTPGTGEEGGEGVPTEDGPPTTDTPGEGPGGGIGEDGHLDGPGGPTGDSNGDGIPDGALLDQPVRPVIDTPQNLRIVEQKPRYKEDGSYVIDATLEFDDVTGADSYEVRISL